MKIVALVAITLQLGADARKTVSVQQRLAARAASRSLFDGADNFGGLEGIEASLIAMAEEGSTPELAPFIQQISLLVDQMKTEVGSTATAAQTSLNTSWQDFKACNLTRLDLTGLNDSLRNCWISESGIYNQVSTCSQLCDVKNQTAALKCSSFSQVDVFPALGYCQWPNLPSLSTYDYMDLLVKDFEAKHANWKDKEGNCTNYTNEANTCYAGCQPDKDALSAKQTECDALQSDLESAACGESGDACSRYNICYDMKKAAWQSANASVAQQEGAYLQEYRGILRVDCLLKAFNDSIYTGSNLSADLTACRGTTYGAASWSHLQIGYHDISSNPKSSCIGTSINGLPDAVPGSEAWVSNYYSNVPTGVVPALCSAACCNTNCSSWNCGAGWYPNASANEGYSNDDCCIAWNGTCTNGTLAPQSQRTKDNQCGSCNSGFYLQTSDDSCRDCSTDISPAGGKCTDCSMSGCTAFVCNLGYNVQSCSMPFSSGAASCCLEQMSFSGEQVGRLYDPRVGHTCGGSKPGQNDKADTGDRTCSFSSGMKYICDGSGCEEWGIFDRASCAYYVQLDGDCSSTMSWTSISTGNNDCICAVGTTLQVQNITDARTYQIVP
eukprot:TRINITY_DN7432_c0_g2_i1.p1 TRINITY_DN7432_c0_g2~~TRINITY_DN7432_c0_g2_i1.p1  ORF type:complete len:611 (+),score=103.69 TRINITY_DN7432_c0_g2_i1:59-1891(+)